MTSRFLIHALGPQGDGVYRGAQGPVYIERALPGETVEARPQAGAGGAMRARLECVLTPSPQRRPPPCAHYESCGGCDLQHAEDQLYRDWKVGIVRDALQKKGLTPAHWGAPVFLPPRGRRRVTFAAIKRKNAVTLGYFRRRSHEVTEIDECLVAEPAIMALRAKLPPLLSALLQPGKVADVFIQGVNGLFDMTITGPVGTKGKPDLGVHEAVAHLMHAAGVSRVSWRPTERTAPEVMLECAPLTTRFGELQVTLPPLAFLQPTAAGEAALVSAVMEMLPARGRLADLFCGCGTFAGAMLARGPVAAFDGAVAAVNALSRAGAGKPLTATVRDLFRDPLRPEELSRYDAVVFDPPRAGAHEQAKALAASGVARLIAVSCNPATFARDARVLADGGYRLESVKLVDQFIWSHHVELAALFVRTA